MLAQPRKGRTRQRIKIRVAEEQRQSHLIRELIDLCSAALVCFVDIERDTANEA